MSSLFKRASGKASKTIKRGEADDMANARAKVFSYITLPEGRRKVRINSAALSRANARVAKSA